MFYLYASVHVTWSFTVESIEPNFFQNVAFLSIIFKLVKCSSNPGDYFK